MGNSIYIRCTRSPSPAVDRYTFTYQSTQLGPRMCFLVVSSRLLAILSKNIAIINSDTAEKVPPIAMVILQIIAESIADNIAIDSNHRY
jgi:hypothetical protein